MKILCRVGVHRWQVSRIDSRRYGSLRTYRCRRCGISRKQAVWS